MTKTWTRRPYPIHILKYREAKSCEHDFFYSKHESFGKEVIINVKQRMEQRGKSGCAGFEFCDWVLKLLVAAQVAIARTRFDQLRGDDPRGAES